MTDNLNTYCASDKDIYDLLMSSKQKLPESVLRELARDRGIFYSSRESRESLVDHLSLLPHDYYDVAVIIEHREHSKRAEKTTSITLDVDLSLEEIKEYVKSYQSETVETENVASHIKGQNGVVMDLKYVEFDFSRTSLAQRQRRDASIEFKSNNGKTTIRMPATEKAKSVVQNIKEKIESKKKLEIATKEIELSGLTTTEDRTLFFTNLISKLPGYKLFNVKSLKVASQIFGQESELVDAEEDDEGEVENQEMLAIVNSIAFSGENLVNTKEYQDLRKRGFFITSITWLSKQEDDPHDLIRFDAGFEEAQAGKGFRYAVRYAHLLKSGEYAKNFRHVEDDMKARLFELIETKAQEILDELTGQSN